MTIQSAFVHIIESPSTHDLLDGRTEGRALSEILNLAKIPYCYNLATTFETFHIALNKRLMEAKNHFQKFPILHLSMHGDTDGIELTDKTLISWFNLQANLAPLNNAMEGGLLICMSTCFGSFGSLMAMDEGTDQPFWSLVGNSHSISWEDAAVAYATFYHLLFKEIPLEECVTRMKLASNDNNFQLLSGHEVKAVWAEHVRKLQRTAPRSKFFG